MYQSFGIQADGLRCGEDKESHQTPQKLQVVLENSERLLVVSSLLDLVSVNNPPSKPKKKKSMQSLACEQVPSLLAVYAKLRFLKAVVATQGFFKFIWNALKMSR